MRAPAPLRYNPPRKRQRFAYAPQIHPIEGTRIEGDPALNIENRKILVLGGYGLVGTAVCRELLARRPREIQIHSLRIEESQRAVDELKGEAGATKLSTSAGNIFGLLQEGPSATSSAPSSAASTTRPSTPSSSTTSSATSRPDIVVDCVNTSTGIAYGDIFRSAEEVLKQLEAGDMQERTTERLLDALYMPRLIRHIQLLYRGMIDAGTGVYVKIGTTGTGGWGSTSPTPTPRRSRAGCCSPRAPWPARSRCSSS